jgi:hypothetical protein
MEKEQIEQKIWAKFEGLEESLKYQIEAQCELLSGLQTIQYLMHLIKNETQVKSGN